MNIYESGFCLCKGLCCESGGGGIFGLLKILYCPGWPSTVCGAKANLEVPILQLPSSGIAHLNHLKYRLSVVCGGGGLVCAHTRAWVYAHES